MFEIKFTKNAAKNIKNLKGAKLDKIAKRLIDVIREDPFQYPPPYEKLQEDLKGFYSRRINNKHRLVYEVYEEKKVVIIVSMWTHYEF